MNKFLLIFLISILIVSSCYGCSFIKERFAKKQVNQTVEQGQQQPQEEPHKKVEPIPVNPQHS